METNEHKFVTDAHVPTIMKWMFEYIKKKRKNGVPLSSIKFVYTLMPFLPAQTQMFYRDV